MRKLTSVFVLLFAAGMMASANAQTLLQIGPTLAVPVGNLADIADVGVGVIGGLHHPYSRDVTLIAHSGYIWYSADGNVDVWEVPILGGAHFHLSPKVYFGAEAGVHLVHVEAGNFDNTETELSIVPMIGYLSRAGRTTIDLNAHLAIVEDGSYLGARIGFMFGG